jgi:hypothetical protein
MYEKKSSSSIITQMLQEKQFEKHYRISFSKARWRNGEAYPKL